MVATSAEQAYETIKLKILRHEILPGAKLLETDLASELKISRTPIRQALTRLAHEGLVTAKSRRGAYVTDLSPDDIVSILELREGLECQAARLATRRASKDEIDNLRKVIERREKDLNDGFNGDIPTFDIHDAIVRMSRNQKLIEFMSSIQGQLRILRTGSTLTPGRSKETIVEHKRIVEALATGDPEIASKEMREHLGRASQSILNSLSTWEDRDEEREVGL